MSYINQIVTSITGCAANGANVRTLDLECSTRVRFHAARRAHSYIEWAEAQMDAGTIREDQMATIKENVRIARRALQSHLYELQRAANYVESDDVFTDFDEASFNSEASRLENDEVVSRRTGVHATPHAWARGRLITSGVWETDDDNNPVTIADPGSVSYEYMEDACDQIAMQYVATLVAALHKDGLYTPRRNDGAVLCIAACAPRIKALNGIKSKATLHRAILELAMNGAIPEKGSTRAAAKKLMSDMWKELVLRDEDDAAVAEVEDTVKEVKGEVRKVIKNIKVMLAIDAGVKELDRIGASDETKAQLKEQLTKALITE